MTGGSQMENDIDLVWHVPKGFRLNEITMEKFNAFLAEEIFRPVDPPYQTYDMVPQIQEAINQM